MDTDTLKRIALVGVALPLVIGVFYAGKVDGQERKPLEILKDRCKTSVRIEPALIYDGDKSALVPGNTSPIRIHRPSANASTDPTEKRVVGLPLSGHVRWFCGPKADQNGGTAEQSRCPPGTNALVARLGPDRLLEIRCLAD
jgi:hypothetical protein